MTNAIDEARDRLAALIDGASRVVAFTGAGISTECGVPDFRSADSPWRRYPPIGFRDWLSSPSVRVEAWRRKFAMDDIYAGAEPGRSHKALARLAADGRVTTVVTQNIDGLHQAAGLPLDRLVELHGNGTYARCLSCEKTFDLALVRNELEETGEPSGCPCGGLIKSATIAFGQPLPQDALRRAQEAALDCDLMLALGSSLLVQPAATLPVLAKRNGAVLVIVNRDTTPLDDVADLVIREDVGAVLQPWCAAA